MPAAAAGLFWATPVTSTPADTGDAPFCCSCAVADTPVMPSQGWLTLPEVSRSWMTSQLGRCHRHGERHADVGVDARVGDLGVDTDHLSGLVEQRAARVAVVDGGVGLDRVGEREPVR